MSDLFSQPFEDDEARPATPGAERRILTVSELTAEIRALLESSFGDLWVEGEISGCRAWNGHLYFTLKDGAAQIKAVMFRSTVRYLKFKPEDGLKVVARGKVSVYERAVFLEPDFKVGPGPAYHVYLVPKPSIRASGDVTDTMYVDLGQLRAFEGSQRYPIPDGVDLANYPSVVIWCETFSVLISPADVMPAGG